MFAKPSIRLRTAINVILKKGVVYRRHTATSLPPSLFSPCSYSNDASASHETGNAPGEQRPLQTQSQFYSPYQQWKQKHRLMDIDEMLHHLHDDDQHCADEKTANKKRFTGEILKISVVVTLGIYFGAVCAKLCAELLELYGIEVGDDDDDD